MTNILLQNDLDLFKDMRILFRLFMNHIIVITRHHRGMDKLCHDTVGKALFRCTLRSVHRAKGQVLVYPQLLDT